MCDVPKLRHCDVIWSLRYSDAPKLCHSDVIWWLHWPIVFDFQAMAMIPRLPR
jgi:hypothetical protein